MQRSRVSKNCLKGDILTNTHGGRGTSSAIQRRGLGPTGGSREARPTQRGDVSRTGLGYGVPVLCREMRGRTGSLAVGVPYQVLWDWSPAQVARQ